MPAPRWVARASRSASTELTRFIAPWAPGWAVVIHRGRKSGRTFGPRSGLSAGTTAT